jgi:hypothetical protein
MKAWGGNEIIEKNKNRIGIEEREHEGMLNI